MKLRMLVTASLLSLLGMAGHAQTIKCVGADGKVTYSNVACPGNTASERSVDTSANTLDGSALREQAQKDKAAISHVEATQREHAAAEASKRQQAQAQAAETAKQEAQKSQSDEAAYANCMRDVERQYPTEDLKAELYAACRTAGSSQRQSGITDAALRECVRNVERTAAYPREKARQIAICHGADVKPEPAVIRLSPTVRSSGTTRITGCTGNQCTDNMGQSYFKQQGNGLVRSDGKFCHLGAGNAVQCP